MPGDGCAVRCASPKSTHVRPEAASPAGRLRVRRVAVPGSGPTTAVRGLPSRWSLVVARLLLIRIVRAAGVLLVVSGLVFAMIHASGDPVDGFAPPGAPADVRAGLRARLGLDDPLPRQYLTFLSRAVRGDLGESWRNDDSALAVVLDRLPATLALAGAAVSLVVVLGLALALVTYAGRGTPVAAVLEALLAVGQAVPAFWLGTVLIIVFAVRLDWLPSSGSGDGAASVVLPAVTLALAPAAVLARLVRTEIATVMRSDVVRTARGKGLRETTVLIRHALRLSLLPGLAYLGLQVGFMVGGAVVVEGVFAYPGLGLLALDAVADRDLPIIQAFVLVAAIGILIVNLATDLLARLADPRLRGSVA